MMNVVLLVLPYNSLVFSLFC